jgi:hypothetical protein
MFIDCVFTMPAGIIPIFIHYKSIAIGKRWKKFNLSKTLIKFVDWHWENGNASTNARAPGGACCLSLIRRALKNGEVYWVGDVRGVEVLEWHLF